MAVIGDIPTVSAVRIVVADTLASADPDQPASRMMMLVHPLTLLSFCDAIEALERDVARLTERLDELDGDT